MVYVVLVNSVVCGGVDGWLVGCVIEDRSFLVF